MSDVARKAAEKRKLESDSIEENIAKSQCLTSGVLTTQNGVHSLNDPRFLDLFRQRQTDAATKLEEKATKTKAQSKKRYDEVKALRAKYGDEKSHLYQTWTMAECSSYLQYKKKMGDPGMPKDVAERRQKCVEWISCPSLPSTPCHSDVEDDDCNSVDQSEVEAGVVGALLSLGDGGTVGLQEEMVGEEDEYGWAPQQLEM